MKRQIKRKRMKKLDANMGKAVREEKDVGSNMMIINSKKRKI